jgi:hypothetical protein
VKTFWNRIFSWLGVASGSTAGEADSNGLIGNKLADVKASHDFFTFFHFEQVAEEKLADGQQFISFKPSGAAFRSLVTLGVSTNGKTCITHLKLTLLRSFIDDPRQCIYAADLVKSFLFAAGASASGDAVTILANEISVRSMSRSAMPMITAQSLPPVPEFPTAPYMTYVGQQPTWTIRNQSGSRQIELRNETAEGNAVLDLTISPSVTTRA